MAKLSSVQKNLFRQKLIKKFKEAISYVDCAIKIQPNNNIYKIFIFYY